MHPVNKQVLFICSKIVQLLKNIFELNGCVIKVMMLFTLIYL